MRIRYSTYKQREAALKRSRKKYYKSEKGKLARERAASRAKENRIIVNARKRERYENDPAYRMQVRATQNKNAVKRRSHLKTRYGMSVYDFDKLIIRQAGRCDCCGMEFKGADRKSGPQVDHNHRTGLVRALVCHHCNIAISWLEGGLSRLSKAVKYLKLHVDVDEGLPQDVLVIKP